MGGETGLKVIVSANTRPFKKDFKKAVEDAEKYLEELNDSGSEKKENGIVKIFKDGARALLEVFGKIGGTIGKIISTVSAFVGDILPALLLALPLMAIAGIISGITSVIARAVSMIKEENKDVKNKIEVIKAMFDSIAYTVVPIVLKAIQWMLNAIIEAFRFLQHIIYFFTGIDVLAYTSDRFAKNMEKANKSAKEIKKQLMGFDEANILQDNSNKNDNLPGTKGINLKIDENYFPTLKEKIQGTIDYIIGYIKGKIMDLLGWVRGINAGGGNIFQSLGFDTSGFEGTFHGMSLVVEGFLQSIKGKFHRFISGPWKVIKGVFTGDWDLVWEGCKEIFFGFIEDITGQLLMIGGTVLTVLYMIYDNVVRTVKDIWDFITWFWGEVGKSIEKFWKEKILPFLTKIGEKIYEKIRPFIITIGEIVLKVIEIKNELGKLWEKFKQNPFQTLWDTYNQYLKPVIDKLNDLFRHKNETFNWKFNLQEVGQKTGNFLSSVWSKISGHDSGGIVLAQPGHGVAIGSSDVMSERRSEAIIPFENPTAMEKIGEAIGKWVNISLENNMVVDGRVLATATNNAVNKERFLMNR